MFYGLSAFCADLLVILGPFAILGAEATRISDWLARRRLDPLLNPALPETVAQKPPPNVCGLLDETTTERIRMAEWLKTELTAKPAAEPRLEPRSAPAGATAPASADVLVPAGDPRRRS